jgi:hypothetical protein
MDPKGDQGRGQGEDARGLGTPWGNCRGVAGSRSGSVTAERRRRIPRKGSGVSRAGLRHVYVSAWEGVAARDLGRRAPGGVLEKGPWLSQVGGRDCGTAGVFSAPGDGRERWGIEHIPDIGPGAGSRVAGDTVGVLHGPNGPFIRVAAGAVVTN